MVGLLPHPLPPPSLRALRNHPSPTDGATLTVSQTDGPCARTHTHAHAETHPPMRKHTKHIQAFAPLGGGGGGSTLISEGRTGGAGEAASTTKMRIQM